MANSYVVYASDGSDVTFIVTFPYLNQSHVKVSVNGVDTAITWDSATVVRLASAPDVGAVVKVYRETSPTLGLVDFSTGFLPEEDLDLAYIHNFYLAQESRDAVDEIIDAISGTGNVPPPGTADIGKLLKATGAGAFSWGPNITSLGESLIGKLTTSTALDVLGFSAFGKTLIDDADAAAGRTTLAVGEKHGDGAVLAPSIAFSSDLDTGFYRPGADRIGFVSGGVKRVELNGSVFTLTPDGVNKRVEISDVAMQLHYDNIVLGKDNIGTGGGQGPNITWKTLDGANPNAVYGSIGGRIAGNQAFVLEVGGFGNHGIPFEFYTEDAANIQTERLTITGGAATAQIRMLNSMLLVGTTVSAGTGSGEITLANAKSLRSLNGAGSSSLWMIGLNSANQLVISQIAGIGNVQKVVEAGAADSGGVGFKMLRVAN